jgi:hypothetical protein
MPILPDEPESPLRMMRREDRDCPNVVPSCFW